MPKTDKNIQSTSLPISIRPSDRFIETDAGHSYGELPDFMRGWLSDRETKRQQNTINATIFHTPSESKGPGLFVQAPMKSRIDIKSADSTVTSATKFGDISYSIFDEQIKIFSLEFFDENMEWMLPIILNFFANKAIEQEKILIIEDIDTKDLRNWYTEFHGNKEQFHSAQSFEGYKFNFDQLKKIVISEQDFKVEGLDDITTPSCAASSSYSN